MTDRWQITYRARRSRWWPQSWPLGIVVATWEKVCSQDDALEMVSTLVEEGMPPQDIHLEWIGHT